MDSSPPGGSASGIAGYLLSACSSPGTPDILNNVSVTGTEYAFQSSVPVAYVLLQSQDVAGNRSEPNVWSVGRSTGLVFGWEYDEAGNRKIQTKNGLTASYEYSDNNELTRLTEGSRVTSFEYDDSGNLTKKVISDSASTETWDYTYDSRNRLTAVARGGTQTAAYLYDVYGQRIRAAEGDKLTLFVYSGGKPVYEELYSLPAGTDLRAALSEPLSSFVLLETVDYVRVGGQNVAKLIRDPAGALSNTIYYHQDHLGSTRLQTDSSGTEFGRLDYEPFGAITYTSGGREPYAYTGQRNDGDTGLYYYGARFYDPALGRFLTADSWTNLPDDERGDMVGENPGGFNRYTYVLNRPTTLNDPTGHWAKEHHYLMTEIALRTATGLTSREVNMIAAADRRVDEGLMTNPITGDQSLHFDTDPRPEFDSRQTAANAKMNEALGLARKGLLDKAMKALGAGLHSLQDIFAHGDMTPQEHGKVWVDKNVLGEDVSDPDDPSLDPARLQAAARATEDYIGQFERRLYRNIPIE